MPTDIDKPSSTRRAFLTGNYFTRRGRLRLATEQAETGQPPPGAVSLDSGKCLAWQRMTCRGCIDACLDNAITTVSNLEPRIEAQRCTGCGKCAAVCPVDAIHIAILGNH
ncbi:MAG: 4Fe-4S binding protein [Gammaproteobacteria bacterium]|nr:4Fe-4S binding protein [Gammaproteobacteria bacterium]